MKVRDIVKITGGRLLSGESACDIDLATVSTDSRSVRRGQFFIALKGENFDGDEFAAEALRKGAQGAIVATVRAGVPGANAIVIQVSDTTKALQDIARQHRMAFDIPVVCVTGSSGKTTIKEMIAALLAPKYRVLKNEGTKNNHIGVPQTLLRLKGTHDICVLELGTNHYGEIRLLSSIARPTIALISNIGPSHLESLGSLAGVFRAKREIVSYLKKGGLLVVNGDDQFLARIKAPGFKVTTFGFNATNDLRATSVMVERNRMRFRLNGRIPFEIRLLGRHNIYNSLAAIAVASHFRVPYASMKRSLAAHKPYSMRLNLEKVGGIDIINDTYNSNPASMEGALETLRLYPAAGKWVVSGDMLELGPTAEHFHDIIGSMVVRAGATGLLAFGDLSRHTVSSAMRCGMKRDRLWHCSTHRQIVSILRTIARRGDVILVKGSRGMKMEKVVEAFRSIHKG